MIAFPPVAFAQAPNNNMMLTLIMNGILSILHHENAYSRCSEFAGKCSLLYTPYCIVKINEGGLLHVTLLPGSPCVSRN